MSDCVLDNEEKSTPFLQYRADLSGVCRSYLPTVLRFLQTIQTRIKLGLYPKVKMY